MQDFVISFMNQFGYIGIMILIAIENVFPPIPSEVILSFGGFMTTYTNLKIPYVILCSTIGSVIGAIVLYFIGKLLNKERLIHLVSGKLGKIIRLKPNDIEKADQWFDRHGNIAVLLCRFVPLIRSLISIPAGMSDMPFKYFILFTIIGTTIWNTVLVILGSVMGENWTRIIELFEQYKHFILALLCITFIICIYVFYKNKLKKEQ